VSANRPFGTNHDFIKRFELNGMWRPLKFATAQAIYHCCNGSKVVAANLGDLSQLTADCSAPFPAVAKFRK